MHAQERILGGGQILFYCQIILEIPYLRLVLQKIKVVRESVPPPVPNSPLPEQNPVSAPVHAYIQQFSLLRYQHLSDRLPDLVCKLGFLGLAERKDGYPLICFVRKS